MAQKRRGRKKGGRNRGFYYRKGRGWYAVEGSQRIPLRYENGEHIKAQDADGRDIQEAHARYLLERQETPVAQDTTTVMEACLAYLAEAKANGAPKTHADRADTLFDFCFGIPPEYRSYCKHDQFRNGDTKAKRFTNAMQKEAETKRIHNGYKDVVIPELRRLDIDQWLNAHKTWTSGGRRSRIQAVKRAFNYAVESGILAANPIRGYRTPKVQSRVTYITPDQEEALLADANPALKMALCVCIRTGARFGCEFIELTRSHVIDHGDRMEWRFKASESKTGKLRIIRITDTDIIRITRVQMEKHRSGPVFRAHAGDPWTKKNLSQRFRFLKYRLQKRGVEFDADCCMYSTRHTYAKRTLEGYWTGKPINIETLARLMGNSPQVCRDHYLQWSVVDNEFLWDAA